MKLKLSISKQTDVSESIEKEISRFPVIIGREENNGVVLQDPFKIISRKHARIIETDGILQLIDLGSANFTFLNDQKVIPNEENALKSGDHIKIGDYDLLVQLVTETQFNASPMDDQKTMVFSSPYQQEINNISENLENLNEIFLNDNSPVKNEMLKFSVSQLLNRIDKSEANKIFAELLAEKFLENDVPVWNKQDHFHSVPESTGRNLSKEAPYNNLSPGQDYSFNLHFSNIVDLLLDTFSKLIQGFLQFRQEFFGVTIFYTLPTGSLKELKEYLFNPDISPDEEKKRTELFKDEVYKLLTHQVGLLEGYKVSIAEGSKQLLQSLNPETIEAGMNKNKNSPAIDLGKILSGSKKARVLELIKENYKRYISDPYHIEKKFFRPSFMKGYQKRISNQFND